MAQYPANIDLSSLNGANGFRLAGVASFDLSGGSVASAGDVNGDGFDDVIVGASGARPNGLYSGASYVVFGKAGGFAANVSLASLNGTNGFKLSGGATYDLSGVSVASAGDINGDGFDDLIIGASGADPNGEFSGTSYVVFGKGGTFAANIDLTGLNGTNGFALNGRQARDQSGISVASAGDVNGDGFDDVIVGGYRYGPSDTSPAYSAHVVFGKAGGFAASFDLANLDGTNGFTLDGLPVKDGGGREVASAGDVNGDGFDDVIVGAFLADPNGTNSGASYVVFGKGSGFAAFTDLSRLDGANGFKLSGVAASDRSGFSVASAGDVNGDGIDDLIIGAFRADPHGSDSGASYVVFGRAAGFAANIDLSALNGTNGFKISGVAAADYSGFSVASAGDVNGDGFDDVIIGASGADPHGDYSGASYVVFGKASGFAANINLSGLNGLNGFKLSGVSTADQSGGSVSSAGDVNGDGFADLIVGASGADPNGTGSGASYVIFGRKPDAAVNRTGSKASQTLAGGDFADRLSALGGDDRLFGYGGNDTLAGGTEVDTLYGHAGNDRLDGGTGADFMYGGAGNDTYIVDDLGDLIREYTGFFVDEGGTDTILSSVDYTLTTYLENLTLTGTGAIDGTGNSLDNRINGNGAANVLRGGAGTDVLTSGGGADTMDGGQDGDYYYAEASDMIKDTGTVGVDTVIVNGSSIILATGNGIENISTTAGGTANNNLTGNEVGNVITGNDGNNYLKGLLGNDTLRGGIGADRLDGGAGRDTLTGGAGADTFIFKGNESPSTVSPAVYDTITDFVRGTDKIDLDIVGATPLNATTFARTSINSNGYSAALSAAQAQFADALHKAVFVAGTTDGWLFWTNDGNATTADAAVRLSGANNVSAIASTDII